MADDDEDDTFMFKEALIAISPNAVLTTCKNGKEIFNLLQNTVILPDMIFLDINMPITNGKDCLRELRKNHLYDEVPIIMYSTSVSQQDIDETYQNRANLYVPKPASTNHLNKMFNNLVELYHSGKLGHIPKSKYVYKHS